MVALMSAKTLESIDTSQMSVVELTELYDLSKFDCGDSDINEFIKFEAFAHQEESIAKTFLFIYKEQILGFCSLAADAIYLDREEKVESIANIGHMKRYPQYPAVKLARFGRDSNYRGQSIGSELILRWIVAHVKSLKIAVRFLTLDAYPHRASYYEHAGFIKNQHKNYARKDNQPVSMRLDLKVPQRM